MSCCLLYSYSVLLNQDHSFPLTALSFADVLGKYPFTTPTRHLFSTNTGSVSIKKVAAVVSYSWNLQMQYQRQITSHVSPRV
jgi:hypothetical protein